MKNTETDLPETFMTEKWVNDYNLESMLKAQDRFTMERGGELKENCSRLLAEVSIRYGRVTHGEPPSAFGAFDRDEIARILAFFPVIEYEGFAYVPASDGTEEGHAYKTQWETDAEEAWTRSRFIEGYEKYLEAAAALADAKGVADARQGYLDAKTLVNATGAPQTLRHAIAPDDALRVIDLEKTATESLRVAMPKREVRP